MAHTYTNCWDLAFAAPYVNKNGLIYRPAFNEVVGETIEDGPDWFKRFSWFKDDIPYLPQSAPVLERLIEEDKVEPKDQDSNELVIRYNVCQQCSREFPAKTANKRFCPECAEERKREADRYAWLRRKERNKKGKTRKKKELSFMAACDNTEDEFIGKTFGSLHIVALAKKRSASSLYVCRCECGEEFVAYKSAILSQTIQMCPSCINKFAGYEKYLSNKEMTDTSGRSKVMLMGRMSGFLTAKGKINESLVLCNCGCGKRIVVPVKDFLEGSVSSCGCEEDDIELHTKRPCIHEGETFGHVTLLMATAKYKYEGTGQRHSASQWFKCRCDCGREFYISRSTFFGKSKRKMFSCGCKKHLEENNEQNM